jgi:hypothetical protein
MGRCGFLTSLGAGTVAAMAVHKTAVQHRSTVSLSGKFLYPHVPPKT